MTFWLPSSSWLLKDGMYKHFSKQYLGETNRERKRAKQSTLSERFIISNDHTANDM